MKNLRFGFILLSAILFSIGFNSCSDDDDDASIVGKWKYSRIDYSVKTDNAALNKTIEQALKENTDFDVDESLILEFKDNGKVLSTFGDGTTYSSSYVTSGKKLTVKDDDGGDPEIMDFNVSKKEMKLTYDFLEEIQDELGAEGIKEATITLVFNRL